MGKEEIQESEPLRIYLNEIGEIPLLDETEEKELGRRISDGDESARARLEEVTERVTEQLVKNLYENVGNAEKVAEMLKLPIETVRRIL